MTMQRMVGAYYCYMSCLHHDHANAQPLLSLAAEMHLAEVSAIRRELVELEREHTRAKQAYEEKIADLKRQIETMRAQTGQGPPIPTVIPANTNHFGALMGHPHGMFGQGGPDRERVELERERAGEQRDGKMVNGSNAPPGHAAGPPPGPGGPGHASQAGAGGPAHPQQQQQGRHGQQPGYGQQPPHHHSDARESAHDREAAYHQQQLGKRTRPDEPMYDGQPPSAKTRMGEPGRPLENGVSEQLFPAVLLCWNPSLTYVHLTLVTRGNTGVESRTSAAASFPPVRPPSRTYAQSPHGVPGRPLSAASGVPTIANAPPSEPSVFSQATASTNGTSNADVKPSVGGLNPPIQLQRPGSQQQAHASQSAASQSQDDRQSQQAKKADGQGPSAPPRPKQPDWDVTYNQEVPKKLEVSLAHTFIHDR